MSQHFSSRPSETQRPSDAQLDAVTLLEGAIDRLARLPQKPQWIAVAFGIAPDGATAQLADILRAFTNAACGTPRGGAFAIVAELPLDSPVRASS